MKLLFDQNISFKVTKRLSDIFPGAKHVSDVGLTGSKDIEIWEFARVNNYCIVSFDYDFVDLSTLMGFPPKIIVLRIGNSGTEKIISRLNNEVITIREFLSSDDTAFLEIK